MHTSLSQSKNITFFYVKTTNITNILHKNTLNNHFLCSPVGVLEALELDFAQNMNNKPIRFERLNQFFDMIFIAGLNNDI